jgi:hypothetical protein
MANAPCGEFFSDKSPLNWKLLQFNILVRYTFRS